MFFLLELRKCCVHDIWVWNMSILMSPLWLHMGAATLWCQLSRHSGVKCQQCGDTEASVHEALSMTHFKSLGTVALVGLGNAPWWVKRC